MRVTQKVRKILSNYESDNPGTKANLARILCTGKLAGTGKAVILPVDQGYEHGPHRSFGPNPDAYDPHYLYQLAIDAGCNAYAAPLGSLEAGADTYAGAIPTILKMNNANTLTPGKDQAVTASVQDALRIGASAIGFTIYPGGESTYEMYEEIRELREEAAFHGIPTVIWGYVRGSNISKDGETAIDTIAYAAHMCCLLGAHIVKVKLPTDFIEQDEAHKIYEEQKIPIGTMAERVAHIVQCCYNGRRIVVFSGGGKKGSDGVYEDARAIHAGGGNGSIIGRNSFQREKGEAVEMLNTIMDIYKEK